MPAAIPENSTRGSSARTRTTSCLGMKLRRIEMTRTLKGSGLVPRNTVQASPTIPGLTSASGNSVGGGGETSAWRAPTVGGGTGREPAVLASVAAATPLAATGLTDG